LDQGASVRVLPNGLPFAKILGTAGTYRFSEGESQRLGEPELKTEDLELLKALIVLRYRVMEEPKP
jgi:hypothetical protein